MSPPRCCYRTLCRRSHRWNHFRFWCGLCFIAISAVSNGTAQLPCHVSLAFSLSSNCIRNSTKWHNACNGIPKCTRNATRTKTRIKKPVPSNWTNRSCVRHFIFRLEFLFFHRCIVCAGKKNRISLSLLPFILPITWRKISGNTMNKWTLDYFESKPFN